MSDEDTFQIQTDLSSIAALRSRNLFQSGGKLKTLIMVLKLKLGLTSTKSQNFDAD